MAADACCVCTEVLCSPRFQPSRMLRPCFSSLSLLCPGGAGIWVVGCAVTLVLHLGEGVGTWAPWGELSWALGPAFA